jgi:spore germination protein KB
MGKEVISNRQGITMMSMFMMGSTLIMGVGADAKQDVWLAIIIAVAIAIPVIAIYARILSLYSGINLYEILLTVFGPLAGRLIALIYIWYAFHLGALVVRNFQEFVRIVSFPETPEFVTTMLMGLVCIWVVKEGLEVLGRWSQLMFIILAVIIVIVVSISMKDAVIDNLRPFAYNGLKPILTSSFGIFSFPFAETVLFMGAFSISKERNKPFRIYISALLIGSLIILLVSVRNVFVLGADLIDGVYFPPYEAVSIINIGHFLQRIEVTVSVVFLFSGFVKISVCLLSACKGIDSVLNLGGYRQIAAPVGLLLMVTSCFIYQNIMEMMEWAFKIYKYYALPFQVGLPVVIWIAAEVKSRKSVLAADEDAAV